MFHYYNFFFFYNFITTAKSTVFIFLTKSWPESYSVLLIYYYNCYCY